MSDALKLIRQELLNIKPFDTSREGFETGILLDANESPWDNNDYEGIQANRYVDSMFDPSILETLSNFYHVQQNQILLTRGSCEGIDLLVRAFCHSYQDSILVCPPTFSIFAQCAAIQGASVITVPLNEDQNYALDVQKVLKSVSPNTKLVFICTPNNPTGNLIPFADILEIVKALQGKAMVVVDEAYMEFAKGQSAATLVNDFSNVVVLRTLSKAFGLAGLRCGALLAQNPLIQILTGMMLPFPFSPLTTQALKQAISPPRLEAMKKQITYMRQQREFVKDAIKSLPIVKQVWDSEGNFLFIKFHHATQVLHSLQKHNILVRHFIGVKGYEDALRISIGLEAQNQRLISLLKSLQVTSDNTLPA